MYLWAHEADQNQIGKKPIKFLRGLYSRRKHERGIKTFMTVEDLKPLSGLQSSSGRKQVEKAVWPPRRHGLQCVLQRWPRKLKVKENLPEDGARWTGEQQNPDLMKEYRPLPGQALALYHLPAKLRIAMAQQLLHHHGTYSVPLPPLLAVV